MRCALKCFTALTADEQHCDIIGDIFLYLKAVRTSVCYLTIEEARMKTSQKMQINATFVPVSCKTG